jgi:hypothetical protein
MGYLLEVEINVLTGLYCAQYIYIIYISLCQAGSGNNLTRDWILPTSIFRLNNPPIVSCPTACMVSDHRGDASAGKNPPPYVIRHEIASSWHTPVGISGKTNLSSIINVGT